MSSKLDSLLNQKDRKQLLEYVQETPTEEVKLSTRYILLHIDSVYYRNMTPLNILYCNKKSLFFSARENYI